MTDAEQDREGTPEEHERDRLLVAPSRELVDEILGLRAEVERLRGVVQAIERWAMVNEVALMLMRETPEWGLSRIRLAEELEAEVERLRGAARRAYDAFSLSAQYTAQERFLAMKALGLALGLVDPGAQARPEAKP